MICQFYIRIYSPEVNILSVVSVHLHCPPICGYVIDSYFSCFLLLSHTATFVGSQHVISKHLLCAYNRANKGKSGRLVEH